MEKQSCYKIGYITRPHGLKGEVTAILTAPIDLSEVTSFFLEYRNSLVPFFIESFSDRVDKTFLKFQEIDSVEKADPLKGCSIYLPKAIRPKLKRGEFYDDEVIDFNVEEKTKGLLGSVKNVSATGPNRLLLVRYNQKELLIPVNGPFIVSVNKAKKLITVDLPDGFLDI
ncbi:MAG: ribosome maturation factor RimM [Cytophagales bacterium]